MKIPKEFELFGHTIRVEFVDNLIEKSSGQGASYFREMRIELHNFKQKAYDKRPIEVNQVSFFHELVHFILFFMKRDDLCEDEKLVNTFAHLLHQALKTAKY